MLLNLLITFAQASPLLADCPKTHGLEDLATHLEAAEAAYADLNIPEVDAAVDRAMFALPCVPELLSPELSAHYHRILALRLFGEGREQDAVKALAASKQLVPHYELPETLLPAGHILRERYEALPRSGPSTRVPRPKKGGVAFDGLLGVNRPRDRYTILQFTDSNGKVVSNEYLGPEDPLPKYPSVVDLGPTLSIVGGSTLLAGGAMFAVAATMASQWKKTDFENEQELLDRRDQINALNVAAITTCGLGAVGGTTGLIAMWRTK